jgi:hypothetical protein
MPNAETISTRRRKLLDLIEAGEAGVAAFESSEATRDSASVVSVLATAQQNMIRGEVARYRAELAALEQPAN